MVFNQQPEADWKAIGKRWPAIRSGSILLKVKNMTKRPRIAVSIGLLGLSGAAFAAAASIAGGNHGSTSVVLLTVALICILLSLAVWSDELDRNALARARAGRQRNITAKD
jgi:peptidoglycan/LPS O-acetylase OafA/YrhL